MNNTDKLSAQDVAYMKLRQLIEENNLEVWFCKDYPIKNGQAHKMEIIFKKEVK